MSDSIEQVWIIPADPLDMAPLPALKHDDTHFSDYNRHKQLFGEPYEHMFMATYGTFEECRRAMLDMRTGTLDEANQYCRQVAASIEHIQTIPTATFPNVQREVRQEQQERQRQEKAQPQEKAPNAGKEVKPALTQPPSRKAGGKVDPKTPIA